MAGKGRNGYYLAEQFIGAIPGSGGIISTIAKRVGCAWNTAKKYCTKYATVRRVYNDECARVLDLAEGKVMEAIDEGDGVMIRYYLSTKGKHRGYILRQEVSGPDREPVSIKVKHDLQKLTVDELYSLRAIAERLEAAAESPAE